MAKVKHTPAADQDLVRISTYIARDNPTSALRWLDEMQSVCNLLATQPAIGQELQTTFRSSETTRVRQLPRLLPADRRRRRNPARRARRTGPGSNCLARRITGETRLQSRGRRDTIALMNARFARYFRYYFSPPGRGAGGGM